MRTLDLPLHPGRCPPWLFKRMRDLAREISLVIINNYGTGEFLSRLSDPMFFQALGCVLAFDWHSSGLTTTTCGALKEAITFDSGLAMAGGKGRASRFAQQEIQQKSDYFGIRDAPLRKASAMSAKVDSSCIQDGYGIYHHSFVFDEKGNWCVIQQGMNPANKYARRYHWHNSEEFINGPDNQIAGSKEERALNLVSSKTNESRKAAVDIINDNPAYVRKYFDGQTTLFDKMPARHEILPCDLTKKDWETLHAAYELQPKNYEELVSLRGMGKKRLRALALVAKLIHGTELDWKDPVKYSFAHGGKDGIPFPVDRPTYESTISLLRESLEETKSEEKNRALKRLAQLC
jgi:hypothetical protein